MSGQNVDPVTAGLLDAFGKSVLIERWIREVWDLASPDVKAAFADRVVKHVHSESANWTASRAIEEVIQREARAAAELHVAEIKALAEARLAVVMESLPRLVEEQAKYILDRGVREVFKKAVVPY